MSQESDSVPEQTDSMDYLDEDALAADGGVTAQTSVANSGSLPTNTSHIELSQFEAQEPEDNSVEVDEESESDEPEKSNSVADGSVDIETLSELGPQGPSESSTASASEASRQPKSTKSSSIASVSEAVGKSESRKSSSISTTDAGDSREQRPAQTSAGGVSVVQKTKPEEDSQASEPETTKARYRGGLDQEDSEQVKSKPNNEVTTCPYCSSTKIRHAGHEVTCSDCSSVIEDQDIDHGPEWRAYTSGERQEKKRTGPAMTDLMHDKGLSTDVGWENQDGYGSTLNGANRKRAYKLRKWQKRMRATTTDEKNMRFACGDIQRICSKLTLPDYVAESAVGYFKQLQDNDGIVGWSLEVLCAGCVYLSIREEDFPITLSEVEKTARNGDKNLGRAYRHIASEIGANPSPRDPNIFVARVNNSVGGDSNIEACAKELLGEAMDDLVHTGKAPIGIAAGAVYAAYCSEDRQSEVTQSALADAADICTVTVRNQYNSILEASEAAN